MWRGTGRTTAGRSPKADPALDRRAYTARSPWTWSSYPFVYSQHADEGDLVREWFEGILEHTIDDTIAWSLQLGG